MQTWVLLVPVEGHVLRDAVFGHSKELQPAVLDAAAGFDDPHYVYEKHWAGRQQSWLDAYGETIPRRGLCDISGELAAALKLHHRMDHNEEALYRKLWPAVQPKSPD